jgi:hypothetical protein
MANITEQITEYLATEAHGNYLRTELKNLEKQSVNVGRLFEVLNTLNTKVLEAQTLAVPLFGEDKFGELLTVNEGIVTQYREYAKTLESDKEKNTVELRNTQSTLNAIRDSLKEQGYEFSTSNIEIARPTNIQI